MTAFFPRTRAPRFPMAEWAAAGPDERHDPYAVRNYLLEQPLSAFFYIVELDEENRGLWTIDRPWERIVFVREGQQLYRVNFFGPMAATVTEVDDLITHLEDALDILNGHAHRMDPTHYEIEKARLKEFYWRFRYEWERDNL